MSYHGRFSQPQGKHLVITLTRLIRWQQAQRQFAAAVAACQDALQRTPQSTVAQMRLQRITEEWALAKQAQAITTFQEALRRGVEQKDQEYAGLAIAYLWRAVERER